MHDFYLKEIDDFTYDMSRYLSKHALYIPHLYETECIRTDISDSGSFKLHKNIILMTVITFDICSNVLQSTVMTCRNVKRAKISQVVCFVYVT